MYCKRCGNKLEEGAKFCSSCGIPVLVKEDVYGKAGADRRTELSRVEEENGGLNAPESGGTSDGDMLPASAEADADKKSGNGKKTAAIAVFAIVAVLIAAGVLFGVMKSRRPEEKEIPKAADPAETEETAEEPEKNVAEPTEAEEQEPAVKDYYVDYETAYKEIVEQAANSEKGASGWSLFDMDGDGMPELFVMEGILTIDYRCVAYTYDIETGTACCLGEVLPKAGALFEPENRESGIIAVEENMGVERVCSVKKEGKDKLNITEISPSQYVEDYYRTPYPINVIGIDKLDSFTGVLAGSDGITGLKTPEGRDVVQITCKAYATSVLQEPDRKHSTANLFDSDPSTVWVEGVEGTGKGEAVVFDTRDSYPADGIVILPGYCRDQEVYEKNGHPVKVTVKCGSMVISESMESFRPDFENIGNSIIYIEFDAPVYADTITVVISKATGGTEYEDTCIAELYPYRCVDLSEYDY